MSGREPALLILAIGTGLCLGAALSPSPDPHEARIVAAAGAAVTALGAAGVLWPSR